MPEEDQTLSTHHDYWSNPNRRWRTIPIEELEKDPENWPKDKLRRMKETRVEYTEGDFQKDGPKMGDFGVRVVDENNRERNEAINDEQNQFWLGGGYEEDKRNELRMYLGFPILRDLNVPKEEVDKMNAGELQGLMELVEEYGNAEMKKPEWTGENNPRIKGLSGKEKEKAINKLRFGDIEKAKKLRAEREGDFPHWGAPHRSKELTHKFQTGGKKWSRLPWH
jgi:hypothetical protein